MSRTARLVLCLGLVAVGCVPAGATVLPGRAHLHVSITDPRSALVRALAHRPVPTTLSAVRAWHRQEARARLALAGSVAVATDGQEAFSLPVSAGGKDGQDVLVMTLPDSRPSTLTLRSGRTGARRWSLTLADAFGVDVARLGPARRPAAVVYQTSFTATGAVDPSGLEDAGRQVNSVTVVDLATGKTDWTSTPLSGTFADNPAGFSEAAALYPSGVLHDKTGDRLLGVVVTQAYGIAGGASQLQPVVFDGASGAMTPLGVPFASDEFAYAEPVGDVSGDGVVDVAQVSMGDDPMLLVEPGTGGAPLWEQPQVGATWIDAFPVADLDGDHRPDVVASTDGGADGTVLAYSGGKGTALWTRSGNAALPLGVVHGRGAVGVMSFGFGPGLGLAAAAVGGTGTSLWSRTLPLPTSGSAAIEFGEAGDVDADHVTDLYADIAYTSATSAGHFADVISGRNGRTTGGRPMGAPLYASVDGHGDDFFVVTSVKRWSMAVYDGNSRHRLWTLSQKLSASRQFLISGAVGQLAGHPGRSLVLSQWDGHHTIVMALQGRSGRRLWSVVA